MEDKKLTDTTIFESALDREERHIKRLMLILVFVIACWVTTVALFVWYISLPVEEETITVENEDGNANYIGNDMNGDFNYGENNSTENTESLEK